MARPDLYQSLRSAQSAVMSIQTVETDAVGHLGNMFCLLEEAISAVKYQYPDLAVAFVQKAERLLTALDRSRLCFPEADLPYALRALRDTRLLLRVLFPDLSVFESVTLTSVLERLIVEAENSGMPPI